MPKRPTLLRRLIEEAWEAPPDEDALEALTPMAERLARRDAFFARPDPEIERALRGIADVVGAAETCPRRACRRAGRCRSARIECFWRDLPIYEFAVWPHFAPPQRGRRSRGACVEDTPIVDAPDPTGPC
jgi:hypothetical protein